MIFCHIAARSSEELPCGSEEVCRWRLAKCMDSEAAAVCVVTMTCLESYCFNTYAQLTIETQGAVAQGWSHLPGTKRSQQPNSRVALIGAHWL